MPRGYYPRPVLTLDDYRPAFLALQRPGRPDECWSWHGRIAPNGYGRFSIFGRDRGAHVVAVLMDGREVPKGSVVMHSCDWNPCTNPRHLTPGSQAQNRRDCAARGRAASGERNGVPRRLTAGQVREIRRRAAAGGHGTQADLAREFGYAQPTMSQIISGHRYGWVS